jgi:hypothetical protein
MSPTTARRRRIRRVVIGVVIALLVAGYFYHRQHARSAGRERLTAVVAQLDAADPRWRTEEVEADRGSLPDGQNSALLFDPVCEALPPSWHRPFRPKSNDIFLDQPPNRSLDPAAADLTDQALDDTDIARVLVREFGKRPTGLRRYPDWFDGPLRDAGRWWTVNALLECEIDWLCRDGRPGAALHLVPAMLNVARSFDREPILTCASIRAQGDKSTARWVERILGQGQPRAGLAEVQALLTEEADADYFWWAVRGERAGFHGLYSDLAAGRRSLPGFVLYAQRLSGSGPRGPQGLNVAWALVWAWMYEPYLSSDHAAYLEFLSRAFEARLLPESEQGPAIRAIPAVSWSVVSPLPERWPKRFASVHEMTLTAKAHLRCAAAGLAVERYRLANGRWPRSLAEIGPGLLPAVPSDPFDGQPLRYTRRSDGVTVYSIGPDGQDDGGIVGDNRPRAEPGTDVCFRLYDPDQRGLPPLPPAEDEEPPPARPPDLPEPRVIDHGS